MFIIQREIQTGRSFCLAWAFATPEELYEFFHESCHQQLKEGLENYDLRAFDVTSENLRYQVSRAVTPIYMKMKQNESLNICQRCKGEGQKLHTCPSLCGFRSFLYYRADIEDDNETLCNCCSSCEKECLYGV